MISIIDPEEDNQIHSISGRIEFDIFYDRIIYLVDFYNYTVQCYFDYLTQKQQEKKKIKDNIQSILKSAEEQDVYVTEDEIFFNVDEEILGIKLNFQEYQKMTLIIILYSEFEKLINNLCELNQQTRSLRNTNIKLENLCRENGMDERVINQVLDAFNNLRLVRNKLVHRYDHWDNELIICGHSYRGVNQLNDEILGSLVKSIIDSTKKVEGYY